jgi:hypothetical protein
LSTHYFKNVFRWLHIVWAFIGASICILLATLKGGHPPGLVFVPVAVAIWLLGHVLLWLSRKLLIQGKSSADNGNSTRGKWPLMLIVFVILLGVVFILGILGLASFFI